VFRTSKMQRFDVPNYGFIWLQSAPEIDRPDALHSDQSKVVSFHADPEAALTD
jgi:hypothetical protein